MKPTDISYTVDRRSDTGVNNVTLGIWLFLASEVMLFGALFSSYALLRVNAAHWPLGRTVLNLPLGAINTVVLLAGTISIWRARRIGVAGHRWVWLSSLASVVFLGVKALEWRGEIGQGLVPAVSTFLAMYFTLTGLHALHVACGAIANVWAVTGTRRVGAPMTANRIAALALYWAFVEVVWIVIFVLMYLL